MSFPAVIHTGETVLVTEKGYAADGTTEVYTDEAGNEYTRDANNDPHILTPFERVKEDVTEIVADVTEIVHDGGDLVKDAILAVTSNNAAKTVEELAAAATAFNEANGGDNPAAKTVLAGIGAGSIKDAPIETTPAEPTA